MIRPATLGDIDQIMKLAEAMHSETRYKALRFNPGKTAEFMAWCVTNDTALLLVHEKDGVITGGFAGYVTEHWCSEDKVSADLAIFVLPEYRNSTIGVQLIKAYVKWAKSQGVMGSMIEVGSTTLVKTDRTCKLFEKIGFRPVGALFTYGGNH